MSLEQVKIIELIKEGKSCNQICDILGLNNKQLYRRLLTLKNNGFFLNRRYYSDGNILYKQLDVYTTLFKPKETSNYVKIITRPYENKVRALAISDIHFGSKLERLDLLDRAYNYCAKNGIHIIFVAGDLIDGSFGQSEKRLSSVEKQISHLKNHYPFDKSILNFAVGGDHDTSALYDNGQDLKELLNNYRHDLVFVSYNNAYVNIKNDGVLLHHHINTGKMFEPASNCPVMLIGHTHKYNITPQNDGNTLSILVPSLSDINDSLPTAVELEFNFKDGITTDLVATQIYFGDKDYILSSFNYSYNRIGNPSGPFYNIESYLFKPEISLKESKTEKVTENETTTYLQQANDAALDLDEEVKDCALACEKENQVSSNGKQPLGTKKKALSQIEKFNTKWGR